MTTKYDPQEVAAAQERLKAARAQRDRIIEEANDAFWLQVRDEVEVQKNLRQSHAAKALDWSREHIRQQIDAALKRQAAADSD